MGSLYERLLGVHATQRKIPVHEFQAAAGEWAAAKITGAQAQAIVTQASGDPLDATGQLEAQDLVTRVTNGQLSAAEVDRVLLLVGGRYPPYDTVAAIRTRLGVQAR